MRTWAAGWGAEPSHSRDGTSFPRRNRLQRLLTRFLAQMNFNLLSHAFPPCLYRLPLVEFKERENCCRPLTLPSLNPWSLRIQRGLISELLLVQVRRIGPHCEFTSDKSLCPITGLLLYLLILTGQQPDSHWICLRRIEFVPVFQGLQTQHWVEGLLLVIPTGSIGCNQWLTSFPPVFWRG